MDERMIGLLLGAVLVVLAWKALGRMGSSRPSRRDLHARLSRRLMGDERAVARMLEAERLRRPDATDEQLFESILQKLERDNR